MIGAIAHVAHDDSSEPPLEDLFDAAVVMMRRRRRTRRPVHRHRVAAAAKSVVYQSGEDAATANGALREPLRQSFSYQKLKAGRDHNIGPPQTVGDVVSVKKGP